MQLVLLVAGGLSLFLPDQLATGILLIVLTLFNAALGLNQEGKAEASVAALEKMLIVKARVTRGGRKAEDIFVVRNGPNQKRMQIAPPSPRLCAIGKTILIYIGSLNPQSAIRKK